MKGLEFEVPEGTVAVVYIQHGEHGDVLAHYAERRDGVPVPREQLARALSQLAIVLLTRAEELDEAAS
ncbi:hypothetical protein IF188_09725 [Microbacterium sp. NEAU-LLC]|uniref:Uncharacterized protein n=1 Tax=Microbacterium helvum TaxID=2773713 RepID=A0ABR8NMT7_9MICO|nr:hypothetical protein [Microbacterium helvum]MBD3941973.1 hypothetical protein [Microbacterium helvum]